MVRGKKKGADCSAPLGYNENNLGLSLLLLARDDFDGLLFDNFDIIDFECSNLRVQCWLHDVLYNVLYDISYNRLLYRLRGNLCLYNVLYDFLYGFCSQEGCATRSEGEGE
jgi:hypothetical protein